MREEFPQLIRLFNNLNVKTKCLTVGSGYFYIGVSS